MVRRFWVGAAWSGRSEGDHATELAGADRSAGSHADSMSFDHIAHRNDFGYRKRSGRINVPRYFERPTPALARTCMPIARMIEPPPQITRTMAKAMIVSIT